MVSNIRNTIDSRDVVQRIGELEDEIEDWTCQLREVEDRAEAVGIEVAIEELEDELEVLKELAREGEDATPDWHHGATLIRDSYFKEYAKELADDLGAINGEINWPHSCIDWDQASRELQLDYTSVEFGGVTYWVR